MEEKKTYVCSKCGMNFDDKDVCLKHENFCGKEIHVRGYFLDMEDNDNIKKFDYPHAKYEDNEYINMRPNKRYEYKMHLSDLKFDEIQNKHGYIYVFTTNLSDEYRKEVINKILNEYKNILESNLKVMIDSYEYMINKLNEKASQSDFEIKECSDLIPDEEFL